MDENRNFFGNRRLNQWMSNGILTNGNKGQSSEALRNCMAGEMN